MDHHNDARIEPAGEPAPGRRRATGWLIELIETLLLTLVIFFGIQAFVAQPFQVEQFSMERTFEQGDYVLIDKLSPRWDDYSRGDIVVFTPPPGSTSRPEPSCNSVCRRKIAAFQAGSVATASSPSRQTSPSVSHPSSIALDGASARSM